MRVRMTFLRQVQKSVQQSLQRVQCAGNDGIISPVTAQVRGGDGMGRRCARARALQPLRASVRKRRDLMRSKFIRAATLAAVLLLSACGPRQQERPTVIVDLPTRAPSPTLPPTRTGVPANVPTKLPSL